MKNALFYLVSVGLAYYGGMKLTKQKAITKTKIVKVKDNQCKSSLLFATKQLDECIGKYDALVEEANNKVKSLEDEIDSCEDKYYIDSPKEYPQKNLEPETVEEKEPEMGDFYDQ